MNHVLDEYISKTFLMPKKDGTYTLLFNVKELNEHVHYLHFKMDTFKSALKLVSQDCWFASVDLKDAYYSVPLHEDHRKFLRLEWNSVCYEFFVLTHETFLFTKSIYEIVKTYFCIVTSIRFC